MSKINSARTIVLTEKGLRAVLQMRLMDAVPEIPPNGWGRDVQSLKLPKPPKIKQPRTQTEKQIANAKRKAAATAREKAIAEAEGRDLFISPGLLLPGDTLLRIIAGNRICLGVVKKVEHIGPAYRIYLWEGGYKTCGETSAVLVAPRSK